MTTSLGSLQTLVDQVVDDFSIKWGAVAIREIVDSVKKCFLVSLKVLR